MSESGGRTSCLAITEKKPQRAGGCIGIFFQLFDWNRRFAKKKLFSKKLLPPVRAKQGSKKFGGDDKLPKLRLIADENSGGFPNVKKNGVSSSDCERKSEMRSPSLVARLMGLESMPSVHREKPKKPSSFTNGNDREADKFVTGCVGFEKEEVNIDKTEGKNEWRPQKLQKTGVSESKPIAKFGTEALHFKNVLSRSRKHQHQPHPKLLGSPVKSPRNLSGKNASRLIGAATKILEPGLQRSRARYALTYSNTSSSSSRKHDSSVHLSQEQFYSCNCYPNVAVTPAKQQLQSSCNSCGYILDISDTTRSNKEDKQSDFISPVLHYVNSCSQGSEKSMPRQFIFYQEPEEEKPCTEQGSHRKSPNRDGQVNWHMTNQYEHQRQQRNPKPCPEQASHRKLPKRDGQVNWHMTNQQYEHQRNIYPLASHKQKTQMPNHTLAGGDRTPKKLKARVSAEENTICETKNVVGFSESFSSHDRSRLSTKMDSCKFQTERKTGIRRKDSMSPSQKKGPTNVYRLYENPGFTSSSLSKNTRSNVTRLSHMGEESRNPNSGKKGSDLIAIPVKQKAGKSMEDAKCEVLNDSSSGNASRKSFLDVNDSTTSSQKQLPLSGDALTALLEQKLKELTDQDEDELVKGGTTPKKTTTMILQELISALTAGQPFPDDLAVQSNGKTGSFHHPQMSNLDTSFTFKSTTTLVRHDHDEKERLSPGSVLEASFSIESCPSSSFGDSSIPGNKLAHESIGCFHDELNTSELDANLVDSATSLSSRKNSRQEMTRLLNNVSEVLCNISLASASPKGNKLTHAKEVLLNAELILGEKEFSVSRFLLTEVETLASIIWMSLRCTRVWNQLEGFTFDSIIEYLDSSVNQFSRCGFAAWSRMPLDVDVDAEMLTNEIVREIRRWEEFAGMVPDDLIEWEMSHGLGKWTDFEIETFETGVEIHEVIIQNIMDEILIDLWKC